MTSAFGTSVLNTDCHRHPTNFLRTLRQAVSRRRSASGFVEPFPYSNLKMTTLGELVDRIYGLAPEFIYSDNLDEDEMGVKNRRVKMNLMSHGFMEDYKIQDPSVSRLTESQLRDMGLSIREANWLLAHLNGAPTMEGMSAPKII
jgi:hypothetical protein